MHTRQTCFKLKIYYPDIGSLKWKDVGIYASVLALHTILFLTLYRIIWHTEEQEEFSAEGAAIAKPRNTAIGLCEERSWLIISPTCCSVVLQKAAFDLVVHVYIL